MFFEYGDDSVAQLGGAHLACEQASNLLTKVLEWGRLAAYLEQSTRYIAYDARLGDRYRYFVPDEIAASPLADPYVAHMERTFDTYSRMVQRAFDHFAELHPKEEQDPMWVWRSTIRAKACDAVRGLLPVATLSNVGMYATGQAYEMALVRMRANPLAEVRDYADMMLGELRKIILLPDQGRSRRAASVGPATRPTSDRSEDLAGHGRPGDPGPSVTSPTGILRPRPRSWPSTRTERPDWSCSPWHGHDAEKGEDHGRLHRRPGHPAATSRWAMEWTAYR